MIRHGDCLDVMATLEPESVSAVVTDPPYGLGFMGKAWDGTAGPGGLGDMPMRRNAGTNIVNTGVSRQGGRQRSTDDFAKRQARDARSFQEWCETWAEAAFRVAKPGAHLLSFGGTRTVHRLTAGLEDAGWEIRDCLVWGYASGFPKSHNLSGEWSGWGTALKPAWEPIVMARKPLRGTVAATVSAYGTGALNIDGTRIGFTSEADIRSSVPGTTPPSSGERGSMAGPLPRTSFDRHGGGAKGSSGFVDGYEKGAGFVASTVGRWPANVILTDPIFDGGIEGVVGGGWQEGGGNPPWQSPEAATGIYGGYAGGETGKVPVDTAGTYSRFFLIPKADRAEREPGVSGQLVAKRPPSWSSGEQSPGTFQSQPTPARENVHPTVKPVDLMRHLVRLVTPPGGIVLDPFLGSGTTGIACEMEGFDWIGIEREAEYVAIAEARLIGVQKGMGLVG